MEPKVVEIAGKTYCNKNLQRWIRHVQHVLRMTMGCVTAKESWFMMIPVKNTKKTGGKPC